MGQQLIESFYQKKNNEQAVGMAAYMKNKFAFLGIPKPEREHLQRAFINQAKTATFIDWNFVLRLWALPEREFQYFAVDYLFALKKQLQTDDVEKFKILITEKAWWDTVDVLAAKIVGVLCTNYPQLIKSHILPWAESENIWLIRTALLFQLKYKERTETEVLSLIIQKNSATKEFFINKAIGWILREYSKTNKEWVKEFVENNRLHPLSVRESSKYL